MRKRKITILTIGDARDYDTYRKIDSEQDSIKSEGFEYATLNYNSLLSGKIPSIKTKKVIIFLCFPFTYWNKYIEHKDYKGIYGSKVFYRKFMHFWSKRVRKALVKALKKKEKIFINNPFVCATYRDKGIVFNRLAKFRISQAQPFKFSNLKKLQKKLAKGDKLFFKPRYGSMGKGITYLSKDNWQTNFIFKNNRIINRRSDHGWKFRNVTNNYKFIKHLLRDDILIQEAIDQLMFKRSKVDFRVYTFFNKAIHVYPRRNQFHRVTTNISQGGRGDLKLLKTIPKSVVVKAKRLAERASKALDITFAGIDIIPDRNLKDAYVIDVNLFSGFPKKRSLNIARSLVKQLGKLDNQGKLRFNKALRWHR